MSVHIIYNKKSGQIIHIHSGIESSKEVLQFISPSIKSNTIEVMKLDQLPSGDSFKVDVSSGKIVATKNDGKTGFANSGFEPLRPKEYKAILKKGSKKANKK